MFYLKLKNTTSRHCFYCNLEQSVLPPYKQFMDVHKPKYAEEFESYEQAKSFKDKWDFNVSFEIVDNLET